MTLQQAQDRVEEIKKQEVISMEEATEINYLSGLIAEELRKAA